MAFAETADLAVRLTLDDQFSTQIGKAQRSLGKFSGSVSKIGRGTGQLASGLAKATAVGFAAVGGGLALVAKEAIDFQDAFQGVVKTVNQADLKASGLTFDQLAHQFRDLAKEIPVAATELAAIGEEAGALGIKAKDITAFTKVVAELAVTTDLTSATAADALGKVGTILGLTGQQFNDFADVLVNLGNNGASTESQIIEVTKRFAAMGKQAGLTTPQILALSSAATSLGAEPEAAGSALSRIFANMSTEIANATDKGKAFSSITGKSISELQKMVNKGQALPILLETLKGISGLSRTEAASVLKALGISNVRDRNAILLMSQNLGFVNEQLDIAGKSTGALEREASKRFDTIASKIGLIKNNLTEAALTIGEGLLPALGRAADKLIAFLKVPENHTALQKLGADLGKALDGINWSEVLSGAKQFVGLLKDAGSVALTILGTLNKLPTEVKALGIGLIGLNKLSGGLVGAGLSSIVGGLAGTLAKTLAASIPVFGKAFVQPVFVTNPGFGSGLPGVGGKEGGGIKAGLGLFLGSVAISAIAVEAANSLAHAIDPSVQKLIDHGISNRDPRRFDKNGIPISPSDIRTLTKPMLDTRSEAAGIRMGVEAEAEQSKRVGDAAYLQVHATERMEAILGKTLAQVAAARREQFKRVTARLAKEKTDPFRFVKKEAQQGDARGGILPVIANTVRAFTEGRTPWARDLKTMKNHLQNLKDAEQAFRDKGDTKTADAIKGQIRILQTVLGTKLDKLKPPKAPKPVVPQKPGDTGSERALTGMAAALAPTTTALSGVKDAVTTGNTRTAEQLIGISSATASLASTLPAATAAAIATSGVARAEDVMALPAAIAISGVATSSQVGTLNTTTATGAVNIVSAINGLGPVISGAALSADTRSEAAIARMSASILPPLFDLNAKLDTSQVIDLRGFTAQAASSARNEAALSRIYGGQAAQASATRATVAAQGVATRAVILAGDTRSEGALSRLNATSSGLSGKMSRIGGSVAQIPGAIRAAKPIVNVKTNVNVSTRVSVRDVVKSNNHIARYGQVTIV